MLVFVSLVMLLLAGSLVWRLVAPRSYWWSVLSWQYRDPEANEPSASAYTSTRVAVAFGLVVLVVAWVIFLNLYSRSEAGGDLDTSEYDRCVEEQRALDAGQIGFPTPEERCDFLRPEEERP